MANRAARHWATRLSTLVLVAWFIAKVNAIAGGDWTGCIVPCIALAVLVTQLLRELYPDES